MSETLHVLAPTPNLANWNCKTPRGLHHPPMSLRKTILKIKIMCFMNYEYRKTPRSTFHDRVPRGLGTHAASPAQGRTRTGHSTAWPHSTSYMHLKIPQVHHVYTTRNPPHPRSSRIELCNCSGAGRWSAVRRPEHTAAQVHQKQVGPLGFGAARHQCPPGGRFFSSPAACFFELLDAVESLCVLQPQLDERYQVGVVCETRLFRLRVARMWAAGRSGSGLLVVSEAGCW